MSSMPITRNSGTTIGRETNNSDLVRSLNGLTTSPYQINIASITLRASGNPLYRVIQTPSIGDMGQAMNCWVLRTYMGLGRLSLSATTSECPKDTTDLNEKSVKENGITLENIQNLYGTGRAFT